MPADALLQDGDRLAHVAPGLKITKQNDGIGEVTRVDR